MKGGKGKGNKDIEREKGNEGGKGKRKKDIEREKIDTGREKGMKGGK